MSADASDPENVLIGGVAATIETIVLQPTLYAKNAAAQGIPLTLDPRLYYRGISASLINEVGQLSLQFAVAGALKRAVPQDAAGEVVAASAAGAVVALVASPCELLMIQQQRFGGSLPATIGKLARQHGALIFARGLGPAIARDAIYVGGMLGATPVVHAGLVREGGSLASAPAVIASMAASMVGGVIGAVASHPLDVVKTCMQGDVGRVEFGGFADSARKLLREGRLFHGLAWRAANITATVYIAHECTVRLPAHIQRLCHA